MVLFPGSNLQYLTGFDGAPSERHLLLFVTETTHALLAPELYETQVLAESTLEGDALRVWSDAGDPRTGGPTRLQGRRRPGGGTSRRQ